jgi:hypothetical protein
MTKVKSAMTWEIADQVRNDGKVKPVGDKKRASNKKVKFLGDGTVKAVGDEQ